MKYLGLSWMRLLLPLLCLSCYMRLFSLYML
jgi:hypothetical protein